MLDLLQALAFVAMLLTPCLIAMRTNLDAPDKTR
jgi:hypothetical protein